MIEHLDGIHETVTYKENSSLRLFVNTDCEDYPIHWHTPMEIIMPLEGTYTVFLGDKHILLQEGDIIFICPGVLHSLAAPESGKRIILQIEWSVVSKIRDLNSILSLISPILTLTPQTAPSRKPRGKKLFDPTSLDSSDYIEEKMDISSYMIFGPIFFASIGLKTTLSGMNEKFVLFAICFVIVGLAAKIIGCGLMSKGCGLGRQPENRCRYDDPW